MKDTFYENPIMMNSQTLAGPPPVMEKVSCKMKNDNNVLYHFIDGFVIEEADTPFNMETGSLLTKQQLQDIYRKQQELIAKEHDQEVKNPHKKHVNTASSGIKHKTVMRKCEYCGKIGKGHHSPRFCTLLCMRRHNVSIARRVRIKSTKSLDGDLQQDSYRKKHFDTPPLSPVLPEIPFKEDESGHQVPLSPSGWTVDNVCKYVESLPGSHVFASDFRDQEIDGSALLLLKEDHLISTLNIKLGPALKLCSHLKKLQE